jgi:hypothetical protein
MNEGTLKTPYPKCRLIWSFVWGGVAILWVLNLVRNWVLNSCRIWSTTHSQHPHGEIFVITNSVLGYDTNQKNFWTSGGVDGGRCNAHPPPPLSAVGSCSHDDMYFTFLLVPLNLTWVVVFNEILMNTSKSVRLCSYTVRFTKTNIYRILLGFKNRSQKLIFSPFSMRKKIYKVLRNYEAIGNKCILGGKIKIVMVVIVLKALYFLHDVHSL